MNALTTQQAQPSGAIALIPRTMDQAMALANMMAKAGFLARELQTPGGALFVIEQAMRWNMSPFAVAMETSFIQGKPMFSGKIVAAACTSTNSISGRLDYAYEGDGEERTIIVSGIRRGDLTAKTVSVRLKDARTNNRHWQTQPDQQLAYHGSRVWARRYTPEVMLGVLSPEEMEEDAVSSEPRNVPNFAAEDVPVTLAAPIAEKPIGLPIIDSANSLRRVSAGVWLTKIGEVLAKLEDSSAVFAWRQAMGEHLGSVSEIDDTMTAEAEAMIADRLNKLIATEDAV